jgi:hypothetical protein
MRERSAAQSFRYALGDDAPEVARLIPELRRMSTDIPATPRIAAGTSAGIPVQRVFRQMAEQGELFAVLSHLRADLRVDEYACPSASGLCWDVVWSD